MAVYDPVIMVNHEAIRFEPSTRIDSFVKIEGGQGVVIGAYVHIASFAHINIGGGEVWIGDHAALASGAKILGGSNQMDGQSMSAASPPEMQSIARQRTVIETGAFIGVNAVVMPGVTIGMDAVIGAGSVVTKNVPAREVWTGVPARRLRARL